MDQSQSKSNLLTPIAIVIAGVIVAGAVLWTDNKNAARPIVTNTPPQPAAQAVDVSKVKTDNEPFIGNKNAPATMAYWYDYQCPFCQRNEAQAMPQIIKDYVETGKLKVVFKDYQFLGPDSQTLGKYSRAVWEVAPDKFYEWHKTMFENQGTENTGWATEDKIQSVTTKVLGSNDSVKVVALVKSNGDAYQKEMDDDRNEGTAMGISGTPAAVVGKQLVSGAQPYSSFKQAIDAALQGK